MSAEYLLLYGRPELRYPSLAATTRVASDSLCWRSCSMSRTTTCACGASFVGADDEELFRLARRHAEEAHTDIRMTDEQIRALISRNARDVAG